MQPPIIKPLDEPSPKVNILLVDDDPSHLATLEAILESLGENLFRAGSGQMALDLLEKEECAVVLLDVEMPGLDGFATAKTIRSRERSGQTPIIFLAPGVDERFAVVEAYMLGAVDYLVRPLIPEILRAKVSVFVELFRKTQLGQRQVEELQARDQRDLQRELFENALRESEGRHRQLADNLPAGFIYQIVHPQDAPPHFSYASRGIETILGITWEEIAANSMLLYRLIDPEDLPRVRAEEERCSQQMQRFDCQFRVCNPQGHTRWLHCRSAPRPLPGGGAVWDGIALDITDRVLAEEALRASEENLREANRRKDDFLAMLAHELRNPLAPIRNSLHLLQMQGGDENTVNVAREMMDRQIQHMTRIVDDLLDVSRITRGKISLRKERVDLARFVRVGAEDHRRDFEARQIKLQVGSPQTCIWVTADSTRLAQVLDNLLTNALKFTSEGGKVEVQVAAEESGRRAILSVRDSGMGIEPAMLPRLFAAFIQADQSLDRSQGGLGLGLAIVKGIVELHGGTVDVTSPGLGQGTTFTVRLPLEKELPALVDKPVAPIALPPHLRVLIVEDNQDAAHSLAFLLKMFGYEVDIAYSGHEGMEAAGRFRPDVMVCDIGLPGMDGYALATLLRQQPNTAAIRLLAVTGYGRDEDRQRALEAGFDQHLTKPVDPQKLMEELEKIYAARPGAHANGKSHPPN